jgi:hypothetical protein
MLSESSYPNHYCVLVHTDHFALSIGDLFAARKFPSLVFEQNRTCIAAGPVGPRSKEAQNGLRLANKACNELLEPMARGKLQTESHSIADFHSELTYRFGMPILS